MPGGNKGEGNVANSLYHFGQRYYAPTTGRRTQQDPLSHLGSITQGDRYLYAGDDPINASDPSGTQLFDWYDWEWLAPEGEGSSFASSLSYGGEQEETRYANEGSPYAHCDEA